MLFYHGFCKNTRAFGYFFEKTHKFFPVVKNVRKNGSRGAYMNEADYNTGTLPYFQFGMDEALCFAEGLIGRGGSIFTPNAEIAYRALHSRAFFSVLSHSALLLPDGIGVVLTERLCGNRLSRLPGVDFAERLVASHRVYFVGGEEGVAYRASEMLQKKHRGMTVVGYAHGYFPVAETERVINDIVSASPEVVLVGMGSPRQELFIRALREKAPTVVAMAVGGSLDVYAKRKKRAPLFLQKAGLEWLYRLCNEPRRWKRIRIIPRFFIEKLLKNRKNAHLPTAKNALREKK